MNDKIKKAAALSGVLLATTAAELISTKELVSEAVDRDEPPVMQALKKPIARSLTDEAFAGAYRAAAEVLEQQELQTLELNAPDGVRLIGHWYPCPGARRTILAFHGWRTTWSQAFGLYAGFWHDEGCSVLFAEQRGQNGSGGECMGFGLTERYDCAQWAEYMACRDGGDTPMYLWGTSMGATTVLLASALPLPLRVRGIVADCGFTSVQKIWRHVASENLHIPFYLRGLVAGEMFKKRVGAQSVDYSTEDALAENTLPVLFVHGEEDGFVPLEMTIDNFNACRAPKRLLTVPGASHAMSYYAGTEKYQQTVREFWKELE